MSAYHLAFQDTVIECEHAKDRAIRWAVGSIDGPRGATWRLWGNKKGDVYMAARSITREVKASFHGSRECHLGFTYDYYTETARTQFPGLNSTPLGSLDNPRRAGGASAMACIEKQRRMVENLADDYKAHRAPDARAMLAGSREGLTRFFLELAWS